MAKYWLSTQQTEWYSPIQVLPSVNKKIKILQICSIGLLLFLWMNNAEAADFHQVLRNLRGIIVPLTAMILVICYVSGIFLIFRALGLMKKFGMLHTMHGSGGEIAGPLTYFIIGSVLIYIPTASDYMTNSLFETSRSLFGGSGSINYQALGQGSSLLGYSSSGALGQYWADLANTLILFIQFLGFLSFVRGWFMLSKIGNASSSQQSPLGKGITHVIGGIGLINIVLVVNILKNTIYGT